MKEEVTTTDGAQTRDMMSPHTPNMFTPNSMNNRQPRGQMQMPGKPSDMKGIHSHMGAGMQHPKRLPDNSEGSDNDNGNMIQYNNPNPGTTGKKMGKEIRRGPEGNMQIGSGDASHDEGQGQPPMYQYGAPHHSPYQYPSYNYQMSPQPIPGQGYGMYPPYSPMMNQRPPMKQYPPQQAGYNYQEHGYAPGMNMKSVKRPPAEYYDEYNYGADNENPQMRGGLMESPQGFQQPRPAKGQKPMMADRPMGQYPPGYQYTNQHMSPMYQPVQHAGHYDPRSPYAPYKPKTGEVSMSPAQPAYYNYKHGGIPPYSYGGGQFVKPQEQEDADSDPAMRQLYRQDNQLAAGPKAKKMPMKPRVEEDLNSKDASKSAKIGKIKQFPEDFDEDNMDN